MEEPPRTWYGVATSLLLLSWIFRLYLFDSYAPLPHGGQALMRILKFVSLGFTGTLPRLYLDITSSNSYPISYNPSAASHMAIYYTWTDVFLAGRLRVATYLLFVYIGPDTRTINGLEYAIVSALAWEMDMPLAAAFFFCNAIEFFVHQPIRRFYTGAVPTEVPAQMRANLGRGAMIYGSLYLVRLYFPYYSYIGMAGATGIAILWSLVVQWINLFHFDELNDEAIRIDESGELVYKALQTDTSFRLLRILPSVGHGTVIRCELHEVPSLEEAPNTYIAVSYRWDTSMGKSSKIIMNGAELMVYPKLERILRDLRASYWSKIVWIDQICINQEDPMEKSRQVSMMDDIYGTCNQVRICLPVPGITVGGLWGELISTWDPERYPELQEVEAAHDLLWKLNTSRFIEDYTPSSNNEINLSGLLALAPMEQWKALANLLDNPWFQRIWIVQEVGLAREIHVHYGHRKIDWDVFVRAIAALARSNLRRFPELLSTTNFGNQKEVAAIDNVLIMESMRTLSKRLPLLETLILCQRFQATEMVDKVYALLGILVEGDYMIALDVDYSSSPAAVFNLTARLLLGRDSGPEQFRVLRFAGIGPSKISDLQSWAPDWSVQMRSSSLGHRNTDMDFAASPVREYVAPGLVHRLEGRERAMLVCKGYNVDRIKLLADLSDLPEPHSYATPFSDALAVSKQARKPYFTHQIQEEAFWRTIIADTHPLERPAPQEYWRHWQSVFTRSDELRIKQRDSDEEVEYKKLYRTLEYSSSADLIFTHLLATDLSRDRRHHGVGSFDAILNRSLDYSSEHDPRATQGRQFCVTERGYMGLVPKYASEGDCIVILHSAMTPHVLRGPISVYCDDCEKEMQCYQLVGEAYVHGMMHNTDSEVGAYTEEEFQLL
jgi:hypothetical protein